MKANWPPRNVLQAVALSASILGRVALFAMSIWLVYVIWRGGWAKSLQPDQLWWIGTALLCVLVGNFFRDIADGAILVPRKGSVGKDGATWQAGDTDPKEFDDTKAEKD